MKGHRIRYSDAELAWLEANHGMVISEYHAAFVAAFGRLDVTASNIHSLRKRRGWQTGRTGRFVKGQVAPNKGVPCPPGKGGRHPNAVKKHFGKGMRRGKALLIYKPIGTERLSKDGYRERKVHDGLPLQSRWKAVHRIEWESVNGPVPEGMALKCLGDKSNTDPSNWALVSRALLPRLNGRFGRGYDYAPAELKPTILAVAKLEQQVRERGKAAQ
jgi:hypothetical protein